ncbi:MAG: cyclic pyranopterin monophosphate synthase MoaC [Bacteroidetes bacterium]|nr:cyclic pyranopterin monophosphate synthase MoaC [Bacteroidota bacterium]
MTDLEAPTLTHIDEHGRAQMVDVSPKPSTTRTAVAAGRVVLGEEAFNLVKENRIQKGDVLTVATIAGVMGAKRTSLLVPLCHDVVLQNVEIDFELNDEMSAIEVKAIAKTQGPTGVEMEALTAVSIAALTIYDMCKSVSKDISVTDVRLLAKSGGQSGDYIRKE